MTKRSRFIAALAAALLLASSSVALGADHGRIQGQVVDAQGAVVPGVDGDDHEHGPSGRIVAGLRWRRSVPVPERTSGPVHREGRALQFQDVRAGQSRGPSRPDGDSPCHTPARQRDRGCNGLRNHAGHRFDFDGDGNRRRTRKSSTRLPVRRDIYAASMLAAGVTDDGVGHDACTARAARRISTSSMDSTPPAWSWATRART